MAVEEHFPIQSTIAMAQAQHPGTGEVQFMMERDDSEDDAPFELKFASCTEVSIEPIVLCSKTWDSLFGE